MLDYAGAIHIHTDYSFDGNVKMPDVIRSAKKAGLDFIVITDHFRMDAKRDGWEGWHDGLLVIVGEEISPRYNHYLAIGIETPIIAWKKSSDPQEYMDAVRNQGGIGLIAHPDHTGAPGFGVWAYPWNDWNVKGYTGVSIWDMMTDWQEKLTSLPRALLAFAFPTRMISGPKQVTLGRWDDLNKTGKVAGFGEIDNHNSRKTYFGHDFRIFPFDFAFRTIRTHILLREKLSADVQVAKKQVIEAIKSCSLYVAQEHELGAKGFEFRIYDAEETAYTGGDFKFKGKPAILEAKIPHQGLLRVIRDGAVILEQKKAYANVEIEQAGVYRIEARRRTIFGYRPWIYSNHIRVI